jgi:hypothetical protein
MSRRPISEWLLIGFMALLMCSILASLVGHVYQSIR